MLIESMQRIREQIFSWESWNNVPQTENWPVGQALISAAATGAVAV